MLDIYLNNFTFKITEKEKKIEKCYEFKEFIYLNYLNEQKIRKLK